jgi:3,4-dihydroxy-2-butanone 4-phosphate synthase
MEMSVALAKIAGVPLEVTICEMMADDGFAFDAEGAKRYA